MATPRSCSADISLVFQAPAAQTVSEVLAQCALEPQVLTYDWACKQLQTHTLQ